MQEATTNNIDTIIIAEEVMEKIAGIAVDEVDGAILSSGGFSGGIGNLLGRKNYTKGIKIETKENEIEVFLSVMVEFGSKIQEVAKKIQYNIRERLEAMTGMKVLSINVSITDVQMNRVNKKLSLDESIAAYKDDNTNKSDKE